MRSPQFGGPPDVARWRASWDRQQEAHEPDRESRFAIMLDFVELLVGQPARVLDLACGTGSIAERVRRRFPEAEVVGVDLDPVLLGLAKQAFASIDGVRFVEADLRHPTWCEGLDEPFDAVLTATALHWLTESVLNRVYADVARLMLPGGVFANADHVLLADPGLAAVADTAHELHRERSFAAGRESYSAWWDRALATPAYSVLIEERARRFDDSDGELRLPAAWHLDRLRRAGFSKAEVVWRWGNDAVVLGVR